MAKDIDNIETFLATVSEAIPDTDVQSHVLKLVDDFLGKNISGLKAKNTELIAKNKSLQESLPENFDSESIKNMLEELKDKSLAEYSDNIRAESQDKLNTLTTQLSESELQRQKLDSDYKSTLINLELRSAAERARVRPDAISDFVSIHSKNFEIKDGKSVSGEYSPSEYVNGVLQEQQYWYSPSVGAGAQGSSRRDNGLNRDSNFKLTAAAQAGDHKEYRRLREEQKKQAG